MIDLETAERLVNVHPELSWDGWNIVWVYEDADGFMSQDGVFQNNTWCRKRIFSYETNGWNIPKKVLGKYNV
jgi:hypothetical protein